jgi:predicted PurR-regulated permease PerM
MNAPRTVLPVTDSTPASRLLTLAGIVVVIAGLYFGRQVLIPLALALIFAFLLAPVVDLLEKCRLGRTPSVLAVLMLSFALLAGIGWGVAEQLVQIMVHLPDYRANIHDKVVAVRAPATGDLGKATDTVNDLSKELSAASEAAGSKKLDKMGARKPIAVEVAPRPRNPSEYLRDLVGPLSGILETTGMAVIFTLFILLKREDLRNRLLRLAGSSQLNVMTQALDNASRRLRRYLLLQFVVNMGYGLVLGVGIYAIGIPHALVWGVLATLLRFVPYVGAPIAAVFPTAMAMAVFPGWSQAVLTFALSVCLEIMVANVIEPWLYGAHTGISSLAILVAAIFWSLLWGPVGLILSTPLTVCLVLIGRYIPQLSFLEILLGDESALSPQAHYYQRLLAFDDDEAREIADTFLKDNSLGNLYGSVLVPALSLAEQDRHTNALDETRIRFIFQSTRDLIDELYERPRNPAPGEDRSSVPQAIASPVGPSIVCIPARDEADEIVGNMFVQLLQRAGYDAHALRVDSFPRMLEEVALLRPAVICVSALPPYAAAHARNLCKQLRTSYPKTKVVLGLWEFSGGVAKAQDKVGTNCADAIGTSLEQLVSLVGEPRFLSPPLASR